MVYNDKFLFIHIPKNAGSSMTQALMGQQPGCSKNACSVFGEYPHYTLRDYEDEMGIHFVNSLFCFALFRNPWERLYSWYLFDQRGHRTRPKRYVNQPSFKKRIFERPFNEWLMDTEFIPNQEYKFNENPIPAQKRSQFDWTYGNRKEIDHIGKVEELNETIRVLEKNGVIKKNSLVVGKANSAPTTTPTKEYRKVYSSEGRDWVAKYFSKDIEYGRYDF